MQRCHLQGACSHMRSRRRCVPTKFCRTHPATEGAPTVLLAVADAARGLSDCQCIPRAAGHAGLGALRLPGAGPGGRRRQQTAGG